MPLGLVGSDLGYGDGLAGPCMGGAWVGAWHGVWDVVLGCGFGLVRLDVWGWE